MPDVRGVRARRIRRPVVGQRYRVRVRVQAASAVPVSGRRGQRLAGGVRRRRRRVHGARVRVVLGVRRRDRLGDVRRGAGRALGAVLRRRRRSEEPARQEPGQPGRQPAAGLQQLPGHRVAGRAARARRAVPGVRARHAVRFPGRVRVDVRHVGRRVDRAVRVHQETARVHRQTERPLRRVLGVRVARASRAHRAGRRAPAVRRGRAAGAAAELPARLLVPEPAVAGGAVRAAGRHHDRRQLRVVRRRRAADRHVRRRSGHVVRARRRRRGQPVPQEPEDLRAAVVDDGPGVGVRAGRRGHRQRRRLDAVHGAQLAPGRVHIHSVRLQPEHGADATGVPTDPVCVRHADHRHDSAQRVHLTIIMKPINSLVFKIKHTFERHSYRTTASRSIFYYYIFIIAVERSCPEIYIL